MATDRREASFTRTTLAPLLKAAGRSGVLVGGQALAVWVFIARVADDGDAAEGQKRALKAIEIVAKLARSAAGRKARDAFDVDLVAAIPADCIKSEGFRKERWPRMLAQLEKRRARG